MVQGFERAQAEYERHLACPFDEGGALCGEFENEDEEIEEYEDIQERKAYYLQGDHDYL